MKYRQFRDQRVQELLHTDRWPSLDSPENKTKGLLELINYVKPRSVVEIGSLRGVSTELFLLHCAQVVAVDPWEDGIPESLGSFGLNLFYERCGSYPHLQAIKGKSPDVLKQIPDKTFDLAYIDGDHTYEGIKKDIEECSRVAKRLSGHDYNLPDVQKAVDELGQPVKLFSDTSWLIEDSNGSN